MERDDDWDGVQSFNGALAAAREARKAERERCAGIVEAFPYGSYNKDYNRNEIAKLVAAAIRKGIE